MQLRPPATSADLCLLTAYSFSWQSVIFDAASLPCSWACTAHFCYLCRQTLRGSKGASGSHFGKLVGSGKCRQHSAD